MRLNKTMQKAVNFANFAKNNDMQAHDAGCLVMLAKLAFDAQVKDASERGHESRAKRAMKRFETKAKSLGYKVVWPGFAPILIRDDDEQQIIDLPLS